MGTKRTRAWRGRCLPRSVGGFLLMVALIAPSIGVGAASPLSAVQSDDVALDLAAMTLTPDDLVAAGIERAGVASIDYVGSHWATLGEVVGGSVGGRDASDTPVADRMVFEVDAAGWKRQYRRVLGQLRPDNSDEIELGVYSDVAEYTDATGADAALTLLTDGGVAETGGDSVGERMEVRRDDDIGVASILVVAFRVDNLLGIVEIVRFQGPEDPEVALGVALAHRLEERIATGRTESRVGMAESTLRLALPASPPESEGYLYLDGQLMPTWVESEADQTARIASYGEAIDVYQVRQYPAPEAGQTDPPRYISRLHRFPDDQAAIEWMEKIPRQVEDEIAASETFRAEAVTDAHEIGDESLTYAFEVDLGASALSGYRIYTRVGAVVARVQYDAVGASPRSAVEALARAQVVCLEAGACSAPGVRPSGLAGLYCPSSPDSSRPGVDSSVIGTDPGAMPVSGGDPARTGANPGPGPEGEPEVRWQFETVGGADTSPVVADNILYFSSYDEGPRRDLGNLFALDASTGEQRWCVTSGTAPRPTPIVADDLIVVGMGDLPWSPAAYGLAGGTRYLVALERATGVERWRFYHGGFGSDVVAADDALYVTTTEGGLWSLDPATGDVRWLFQAEPNAGLDEVSFGAPAVADGIVYVAGGGLLHAVDATSGEMQWQVGVGDEEYLGVVAVAGETVFVTSSQAVYAVAAVSGEERWRFAAEGTRSLAVVDEVVYIGTASGSEVDSAAFLHAIDATSGEEQWQYEANGTIGRPAIVDDLIYIATTFETGDETEGAVSAISAADGQEVWQVPVKGSVTGPTVIGGMVFVGTETDGQGRSGESGGLLALGSATQTDES